MFIFDLQSTQAIPEGFSSTTAIYHPGFRGLRLLVHLVTFMSGDRDAFQNPARHLAANRSVQFASAVFQGIMQKYNKVLKKLELRSGVICSSFERGETVAGKNNDKRF